jgi:predicted phage terminase large subunit-like protein
MMARWHQDDLAGRILKEEPGEWEVINFEATAGDNDPLGREKGQALWPQRYDVEAIGKIKKTIGTKFFNALFRGTPDDPESQIIKRGWIKYYKKLPIEYSRFGGIDTATSSKTISDNMSMVDVCKDLEGYLYVDDCFLDKISVYGFSKHVNAQHAAKKYSLIKLEANNAGEAIKQRIDEVGRDPKLGSHPPVRAEATTTDKCVRVNEIAPLIENGTLRFKLGDPRIAKLVDHLIAFDGKDSDIDDDVDALGFAVKAATGGAAFFSSTNNYDVYQKGQK